MRRRARGQNRLRPRRISRDFVDEDPIVEQPDDDHLDEQAAPQRLLRGALSCSVGSI